MPPAALIATRDVICVFRYALTLYTCFLFRIASIRNVFGQRGNPDSSAFQAYCKDHVIQETH